MSNRPVPYPGALSEASAAALIPGTIISAQNVAAAGSVTTPEMSNLSNSSVRLIVDVNTVATTGTVTVKIQVFDGTTWVDLPGATTGPISTVTQETLTVDPALTVVANEAISQLVGPRWRVVASVATDTVNFSVSAFYLD